MTSSLLRRVWWVLGWFVLGTVGLPPLPAGHVNQAPRHYLERGRELAEAGRYQDALQECRLALDYDPLWSDAYAARAAIWLQLQNTSAAYADLTEALRLDRRCADAYVVKAQLYQQSNNLVLALTNLDKAIECDPKHARAFFLRGLVQKQRQRYAEAIADFTLHLSRINPNDLRAYFHRGQAILQSSGNFEAAISDLNKVLLQEPDNVEALVARAQAHLRRGRRDEARADLNRAAAVKPDDPQVRLQRGLLAFEERRWEDCIADLTAALKDNNRNIEALMRRGYAYVFLNRSADAVRDFDRILEIAPNHMEALSGKASACERVGDWSEAEKIYTRILQLQPRNHGVYVRRGDCRRMLNRPEEALEDFNQAIAIEPEYVHAYTHRAHLHLSMGKLEEARADYRLATNAARLQGRTSTAGYAEVLALFFEGKWEEAQQTAEKMVREHRLDNEWLYDMACAYAIAAELATKDKRLEASVARHRSDLLARRALELLEKAVEAGFTDLEHMRKDPDFHFVKQSPRFRRLCQGG